MSEYIIRLVIETSADGIYFWERKDLQSQINTL